jgi:hypothetical protein
MKKTFSENTMKKPSQKVTRLEQAKRLRQEAEAILIDLALEHGHSNESCDFPCGHEQTCDRCGFYGKEEKPSREVMQFRNKDSPSPHIHF